MQGVCASKGQETLRVYFFIIEMNLEMQVRAGRVAGVSRIGDQIAL